MTVVTNENDHLWFKDLEADWSTSILTKTICFGMMIAY